MASRPRSSPAPARTLLGVLLGALLLAAAVAVPLLLRPTPGDGRGTSEDEGWQAGRSMSQRRSYIAAAEVEGRLYVAGGMVGETGRRLRLLQRYDPATDAWTGLASLPVATRAAAAAAVDGQVYVIGGDPEEGDGRQVWAYDVAADRWRARAPLPVPRFNHATAVVDGRIHVLGGYQNGQERAETFVYDPMRNRWERGPDLPEPNHAFAAAVLDGAIWTVGGRIGERVRRDVWILDPGAAGWRRGPSLPRPMELLGADVAGREIHAVWESTYQIYDAATGRWRQGPSPRVHRHGLSVFHVDDRLYAIGGCTTELRDSQALEVRRLTGDRPSSAVSRPRS